MYSKFLSLLLLGAASPAAAADEYLELWLKPSLVRQLDKSTFVEVETEQRFRDGPAANQYVGRLWLGRSLAKGVTGMIGVHRGVDTRETRLLQQIGYPLVAGLKGRTRLEQRFIDDDDRTGWRVRQRLGTAIPLGQSDGWELAANVEGFFTLRSTRPGGTTGLTGLRTFVGFEREYDKVELSVGYSRQQNIRRGAPDRVGHAPTLAMTFKI